VLLLLSLSAALAGDSLMCAGSSISLKLTTSAEAGADEARVAAAEMREARVVPASIVATWARTTINGADAANFAIIFIGPSFEVIERVEGGATVATWTGSVWRDSLGAAVPEGAVSVRVVDSGKKKPAVCEALIGADGLSRPG
jgi:hypothetical protein